MFVHGREAYRRNSYLVLYLFYKNILYVLPIFYFGFLSEFSGTAIYDNYMYQTFNVFFTGCPIIWYCTFDWQQTKEILLSDPSHYRIGLKNKCFNKFNYWRWYIYAIWQSALILFLAFYTLEDSVSTFNGYTVYGSLMLDSTVIIQAIVVLVTVKLIISSHTHTKLSWFLQLGSVGFFYLQFYCESIIKGMDLAGMFGVMLSFISQYFLMFLFMTGFILVDYGMQFLDLQVQNVLEQLEDKEMKKEK